MDTVEKFKNALKELKKNLAKNRGYLERQAIYLNRQIERTAKRVFAGYAKEYPKIQGDKIQEFIMESWESNTTSKDNMTMSWIN